MPRRPLDPSRTPRIRILDVEPAPGTGPGLDTPRAVAGEWVTVAATLARDGDDRVAGLLRYRRAGRRRWQLAPLEAATGVGAAAAGRHAGSFVPDEPGRWEVQLDAWVSLWESWRAGVSTKVQGAGQPDYSAEIAAGRALLEPWRHHEFVADTLSRVEEAEEQVVALVVLLGVEALPDRHDLVSLRRPLVLEVDPAAARTGVWVELPAPGSELRAADAATTAGARLAASVAALGADTALLPGVVPLAAAESGPAERGALDTIAALLPAAGERGLRLALRVQPAAVADPGVLATGLLGWVAAGVDSFQVDGAATLPLAVWQAAIAEVRAAAPDVLLCASGPLRPGLERALGGAGFAQASLRLDAVPSREEAEALLAPAAPSGTTLAPRRRLVASGGAALAAAAVLGDSFGLEAPAGGALALLGALLAARRDYPALRPGAETIVLDAGDDRALAVLRRTPFDEALLVVSRDPAAPVEATVTLPGAEGRAGVAGFPALDLLGPGERRLEWSATGHLVVLPPGGMLLLRLER